MIGHTKLLANISSYGDYPFPEQFSVFRELMERYFNAILFVNFFLTTGNATVLRHISDYTTTYKHVNIESWPSIVLLDPDRLRQPPFWNKVYSPRGFGARYGAAKTLFRALPGVHAWWHNTFSLKSNTMMSA